MYNVFLFDFDGCLMDSLALWTTSYITSLQKQGVTISEETILKSGLYNDCPEVAQSGIDFALLWNTMDEYFAQHTHVIHPFPHTLETLRTLKNRNKKTAVVTSSSRRSVGHLLNTIFAELIDVSICRDDVPRYKPHPEPIHNALKMLNALPDETIFIGDAHTDIMAGLAAGVKTVFFDHPTNRKYLNMKSYEGLKPDHIITSLHEILRHA